ncbi:MAG: cytochrome d ubiquinol oxidase subunit II [Rickettsiaceae bacterium]
MDFIIASITSYLPIIFVFIIGFVVFAYVVLDGYDLGVGMLLNFTDKEHQDIMLASIKPFWDANETWLVLAAGVLMVAFPNAQGFIFEKLYIPTGIMLGGLILRGAAFDFRDKIPKYQKHITMIFSISSLLVALSQGYMLGFYIMGLEWSVVSIVFSLVSGLFLSAAYSMLGAGWLIIKTSDEMQLKSIQWMKKSLWISLFGLLCASIVSPLVSDRIFDKWFSLPHVILLPIIPICIILALYLIRHFLSLIMSGQDKYCHIPFFGAVLIFIFGFISLAYSFFPYIIPDQMDIYQAFGNTKSLLIVLAGVAVVLPCIIIYTIFVYRVFYGKVEKLSY